MVRVQRRQQWQRFALPERRAQLVFLFALLCFILSSSGSGSSANIVERGMNDATTGSVMSSSEVRRRRLDEDEDEEGVSVCRPSGECESCPEENEDDEECVLHGRRQYYSCSRTVTATTAADKKSASATTTTTTSNFNEYRSCSVTPADEVWQVVRFQLAVLIIGILAMIQGRKERVRNMSTFDRRRAVGYKFTELAPVRGKLKRGASGDNGGSNESEMTPSLSSFDRL
jgi:hypothetical protein